METGLTDRQQGVLRGMAAAAAVTAVGLVGAVVFAPLDPVPRGLGERLAFALRWDALVVVCLAFCIARLARHRFFTPADIDGSGLTDGTDAARVMQAVLQNTLEQTVLAALTHLIWAATMPASWLGAVPAAAALFLVGRISFIRGYAAGAPSRAFGFALTFYPSVVMVVAIALRLVHDSIG